VELAGTGNLPAQLTVPTRSGVEWLTPEQHEKLGAVRGTDKFGGKRTFSYVVRMQAPGEVDLGELRVPYWDPDTRNYGVAMAKLGSVRVTGTALANNPADAPFDPLPGLPDARTSLAGRAPAVARPFEGAAYALGLLLPPLAYPLFAGGRGIVGRIRERRKRTEAGPRTEMRQRIADAEKLARGQDAKALDHATLRALEASAVACLDVSMRGALVESLAESLAAAGVEAADAHDLASVYAECQTARFSPSDVPIGEAQARWATARSKIRVLERSSRATGG
jgi:hypothetical protein